VGGGREAGELLRSTWILARLFFFFALHLFHLVLSPSHPLLSCTLSLSLTLSRSFSPVFLALAGHAAAAELVGSLGFMVAALPLSNDGLVNSDLRWCGETFPHAQFALCVQHLPRGVFFFHRDQGYYNYWDFLNVLFFWRLISDRFSI